MKIFLMCTFLLILAAVVVAKHCEKKHYKGCMLSDGECACSKVHECDNPFPYKDEQECLDDLSGVGDKCIDHPCHNGGACVQVQKKNGKRKWECECAGTGYYGKRCGRKCPEKMSDPLPKNYPNACIMLENEKKENEV